MHNISPKECKGIKAQSHNSYQLALACEHQPTLKVLWQTECTLCERNAVLPVPMKVMDTYMYQNANQFCLLKIIPLNILSIMQKLYSKLLKQLWKVRFSTPCCQSYKLDNTLHLTCITLKGGRPPPQKKCAIS